MTTNADTFINHHYVHDSDTPVDQIVQNPHLKVNINMSCVKFFDFDMNLYFDMNYFTYLYFSLLFGFANPATQI